MAFVPGHKHDLFLSYAHSEAAWLETFRKALCDEFRERTGEEVTVWQDTQNLRVGQEWRSEIEEGIRSAAAFLAVVSPAYLSTKSPWCARERAIALENGLDALKAGSFYRFLKVIKTPGPGKLHEEVLHELQDIRFFNQADGYELLSDSREFIAAVRALFRNILELLMFMSNSCQELYLATGAIEMHKRRADLECELVDRGFSIRPKGFLDRTFPTDSLRREMEKVSHVLFVLGGDYDEFTGRQIKVAKELGKPVVFWVQPGEKQEGMLHRIQEMTDLPPGSEVLGGRSIRELIPQLLEKVRPRKAIEAGAPASGTKRVYLNYDYSLDSGGASPIADAIAREFEVVRSGRDGDHEQLMRTSNGVLLFRAANPNPDEWLKFNAMELIVPAQALERQAEFDFKALLVTEPARIQARVPGVPVYAYTEPFEPKTLEPFFDGLRRARSADASQ